LGPIGNDDVLSCKTVEGTGEVHDSDAHESGGDCIVNILSIRGADVGLFRCFRCSILGDATKDFITDGIVWRGGRGEVERKWENTHFSNWFRV
jgi:hypothetical protein